MDNKDKSTTLEEFNEAIYSVCGVPSKMFGDNDSPSVASAKIQADIFQKTIENILNNN